jgi:hypothetical protein
MALIEECPVGFDGWVADSAALALPPLCEPPPPQPATTAATPSGAAATARDFARRRATIANRSGICNIVPPLMSIDRMLNGRLGG